VYEFKEPRGDQVRFLQDWLKSGEEGKDFLRKRERLTWNDKFKSDLIVLSKTTTWWHPQFIEIAHWLHQTWIRLGWKLKKKDPPDNTPLRDFLDVEAAKLGRGRDLEASSGARVVIFIWKLGVILVAAMLPILAVLALYYIPQTSKRIGAAVGMTAFAALFLRLCTSVSVKEIFGATAAYVANSDPDSRSSTDFETALLRYLWSSSGVLMDNDDAKGVNNEGGVFEDANSVRLGQVVGIESPSCLVRHLSTRGALHRPQVVTLASAPSPCSSASASTARSISAEMLSTQWSLSARLRHLKTIPRPGTPRRATRRIRALLPSSFCWLLDSPWVRNQPRRVLRHMTKQVMTSTS
jgi:hypothetical protein